MLDPSLRRQLRPVTLRQPLPLEVIESKREIRARVLLVLALLVAIYLVLALGGCAADPEPVTPAPSLACAWGAPLCCSTPPGLGVHPLRDLRAERFAR